MEKSLPERTWPTDELAFKVIKEGSEKFTELTKEVAARGWRDQSATVIYDSLALRYNQMAPGDLLILALPNKPQSGNLRKTLESRGLQEKDFRLFQPMYDENGRRYPDKQSRPLVVQRITDAEMRTVQSYPAVAMRIAREAEQRGETYPFGCAETPENAETTQLVSAGIEDLVNT